MKTFSHSVACCFVGTMVSLNTRRSFSMPRGHIYWLLNLVPVLPVSCSECLFPCNEFNVISDFLFYQIQYIWPYVFVGGRYSIPWFPLSSLYFRKMCGAMDCLGGNASAGQRVAERDGGGLGEGSSWEGLQKELRGVCSHLEVGSTEQWGKRGSCKVQNGK